MVPNTLPVREVPSPAVELAPLLQSAEGVARAFLLGYEGNTRAAYARDLTDWVQFCAAMGLDPLHAPPGFTSTPTLDRWLN